MLKKIVLRTLYTDYRRNNSDEYKNSRTCLLIDVNLVKLPTLTADSLLGDSPSIAMREDEQLNQTPSMIPIVIALARK